MNEAHIPPTPSDDDYARQGKASADPFSMDDPFALFANWFAAAKDGEPRDPHAMVVATVDAQGRPDTRTVLLKDFDEAGFVFYTNTASAKGRQLAHNAFAALNFYWRSTACQVRVRGPVTPVGQEEADAYFASRARDSQIGAWASEQSQSLSSRAALEARIATLRDQFGDNDIPRPPHWHGYRVAVMEIEFWAERPYRLHDRRLFQRTHTDRPFESRRLYP